MGSYTVEQVEFLRQRADISYEQALEVLERYNGDLTRCLVDLERRGLIRRAHGESHTQQRSTRTRTPYASSRRSVQPENTLGGWLKKLMRTRLVVTKEKRTYADLPIPYFLFALLVAPHLMIITVVTMFVCGLKIRIEGSEGTCVGNEEFYNMVDKAADNIKTTVTSFTRAAKENGEKARRTNVEAYTPYTTEAPQAQETQEEDAAPEEEQEESTGAEDIPEVKAYEEFTGEEETEKTDKDADENEFTIG